MPPKPLRKPPDKSTKQDLLDTLKPVADDLEAARAAELDATPKP